MHRHGYGCCCGCHGSRRYLTEDEKKEKMQKYAESLKRELQAVKEELQQLG